MTNPAHELAVWLIDDDEDDHFIIQRVMLRAKIPVLLRCFPNAVAAMEELRSNDCVSPDLIICDLKMPALSGDTFVRWLRSTRHASIPVVMRSTSELERDIASAYESGANAFVRKGMDLISTGDNVHNIVRFGLMLKQARSGEAPRGQGVPHG
jgi:CheY-like chemotaxis protein